MTVLLRGWRRLRPASRIALGVLLVIVVAALAAPLIARHDPLATGVAGQAPSGGHWFGTDRVGRDVFARVLYGARWSLAIGLGAAFLALVAGALLGSVAATAHRAVDEAVMRCLDVIMAFPAVALAAVLVTVFGKSLPVLIGTIAFLYVPQVARVVRGNVLSQYGEDYVAAERVLGARRGHILWRHVLINCAAPILVFVTIVVANAIVFEASLSFVGAGVQDPDPSWGSVIAYGKTLVLAGGWWATFFPGLFILVTVLVLNVLSEGVSDAWAAPAARSDTEAAPGSGTAAATVARPAAVPASAPALQLDGDLREAGRRLAGRARPLPDGEPLLRVEDLTIGFPGRYGDVDVVDRVSLEVRPGEVVGLVGESGCGKSLTSLAIMGLEPRGARVGGRLLFDGRDLRALPAKQRRALLGHDMAMIYQDALSSLNPAMTIRAQLRQLTRRGGTRTPAELLELVGLDPDRTLRAYPHELSGGQRQRVLIAMALSRDPRLVVADEPTTALDVTVQAAVMRLLLRLRAELGFALILVSHDLALVADVTDRVVVMYGGQVAEAGVTSEVVGAARHHYARGLLGAVVSLEAADARPVQIPGVVPSPAHFPAGCRFADRCAAATELCATTRPEASGEPHRHAFACHHPIGAAEAPVTAKAGEPR
ncbi:dipeptide/oligopeptide/nickel ABC transporter permease/ATP-binding protein [Actinomadura montaniterrae]|uniref:Dipeptide/oligopeptide/nickel ABC transporter permease/ATP-binding protein n=1 Tax=Actinomadura montaniterrae TaxID=1803903 RepID=A0A6L3VSW0_9ACTN|nr:dipeptide/oligopeptide/nickel ABC transporter permease/ATP-binding protein [Actinomadura montaniterrae]KAB2379944.1 dipeptide/oligopeptide/nickel ABC transporter permease/ATP-binding protein [Actinomadura montaniterrae]